MFACKSEEISFNAMRFLREIYTLSIKHKNIIEVTDAFLTPGGDFIIIGELA